MLDGIMEVEYIERKGIGHPDSVADIISEEIMQRYREYVFAKLGILPNGWFDKVVVAGGEAEINFGSSEIIKKPKIILYGKAMKINGSTEYISKLFNESVSHVIGTIFGEKYVKNVDVAVEVNSGVGAEHAKHFYDVKKKSDVSSNSFVVDSHKANDTVICSGWWPFTITENSVVMIENYINSPEFKKKFPLTGYDVKVMTARRKNKLTYVICVPFIADITPSRKVYDKNKQLIVEDIRKKLSDFLNHNNFEVSLNTKDTKEGAYLTVFGSAFDKGDVGVTGRGNRYPGLICAMRPSGVEAYSGKNTFNHSGKLYSFLAFQLAKNVTEKTGLRSETVIASSNGAPILEPQFITIFINGKLASNKDFKIEISSSIKKMKELAESLDRTDTVFDFINFRGF